MNELVRYTGSRLLPSRVDREVTRSLNVISGREAVTRAQINATVRTTTHALMGAATISQAAGVLSAADPVSNDALSFLAQTGIAKIADILRSS